MNQPWVDRNKVVQLVAELCREAGVLFAVFGPLENSRDESGGWPATTATVALGLLLMVAGIILEVDRARRARVRRGTR